MFLKISTLCFFFSTLTTTLCADAQAKLDELCSTSGLNTLMSKNRLKFTFNAKLTNRSVSRSWDWDIQNNTVKMDGKSMDVKDQKFVNDCYWLIFPLMAHFSRDQVDLTLEEQVKSPLSGTLSSELKVAYKGDFGYTPQDAYKLYINEQGNIIEWAFLKSGKEPAARINHWKDYQNVDGVTLSLDRPGENGFRIWFTDVELN
jgi:hypothetical protein